MEKLSNKTLEKVIFLSVFGLFALFAGMAKADQVYTFNDDLSSTINLDFSQTQAVLINGKAFIANNSYSSAVVSAIIANPTKNIINARIDANSVIYSGNTILYYVSNNNGARWQQMNPGYTYTLDATGNQLRWKAVLIRNNLWDQSAYLDSVLITYTTGITIQASQALVAINDPEGLTRSVLNSLGIGFSAGNSANNNYAGANQNNSGSTGSVLGATIYTAGKKSAGSGSATIVRAPGQTEIYEIMGGKKHLIPTMDIFYNYGFTDEMIQNISAKNLAKYPRVKLLMSAGNKNSTYYLTEGGMIRLVPRKDVFDSYGDRNEDIIEVSKKEFNFYPRNQFVFLERPLNRDVFQITDGMKRYLTPMAVQRMVLTDEQIAPINETELAFYKTGRPIIY